MTDQRSGLITQAARFDDDTLAHLANKGLVRRAKKLVDAGVELSDGDDSLVVEGDGWSVNFAWDEPLADGHCGCATAGVCQHLVAAIIALRSDADSEDSPHSDPPNGGEDSPPTDTAGFADLSDGGDGESDSELESRAPRPTEDGSSIRQSLLAMTDDALRNWAKKADSTWAQTRAASLDPNQVVIDDSGSVLVVDLPTPHASVRFVSSTPDEALVKPASKHDRRATALAVLAIWLVAERELAVRDEPPRPTELLVERNNTLRTASQVTTDLVRLGLLYLGNGERERLDSLAAACRGVKLYRLAILAERASDQLAALDAQTADASTDRLLAQLAEISTVAERLSKLLDQGAPLPDGLVGRARARYEAMGHLQLIGLGHYPWGDRRFAGTTAVLAESSTRFFTVSRPELVNGRMLSEAIGWEGAGSASSLSGRRVTLANALASDEHRLSGSAKTSASIGGPITQQDLNTLAWAGEVPTRPSRLAGRTAALWTLIPVAVVEAGPAFDDVDQSLAWAIQSYGHEITMRTSYRQSTKPMIDNIEHLFFEVGVPPEYVIARLDLRDGNLTGWPIATVTNGELFNLSTPRRLGATHHTTADEDEETPDEQITSTHLSRLGDRIVRIAERGCSEAGQTDLARTRTQAFDHGFVTLSTVIGSTTDPAVAVLRAAWVHGEMSSLSGEEPAGS